MAVFGHDDGGIASGMDVGRTIAEVGLWRDSLDGSGSGGGLGRGPSNRPGKTPGGSEPGCSCGGCLVGIGGIVVALVLLCSLMSR